jgi:hypothetical protein
MLRHSGAGRNPANTISPRSGQDKGIVPLRGKFFNNWIPACAGMTV